MLEKFITILSLSTFDAYITYCIRDFPVMAAGCDTPINFKTVGATSHSAISSLWDWNFTFPPSMQNGTENLDDFNSNTGNTCLLEKTRTLIYLYYKFELCVYSNLPLLKV